MTLTDKIILGVVGALGLGATALAVASEKGQRQQRTYTGSRAQYQGVRAQYRLIDDSPIRKGQKVWVLVDNGRCNGPYTVVGYDSSRIHRPSSMTVYLKGSDGEVFSDVGADLCDRNCNPLIE